MRAPGTFFLSGYLGRRGAGVWLTLYIAWELLVVLQRCASFPSHRTSPLHALPDGKACPPQ